MKTNKSKIGQEFEKNKYEEYKAKGLNVKLDSRHAQMRHDFRFEDEEGVHYLDTKLAKDFQQFIITTDKIQKYATLSDDGRSLIIRIPAEITEEFKLREGKKVMLFSVKTRNSGLSDLTIRIVDDNNNLEEQKPGKASSMSKLRLISKILYLEGYMKKNKWLTINEMKQLAREKYNTDLSWKTINDYLMYLANKGVLRARPKGEQNKEYTDVTSIDQNSPTQWLLKFVE